MTKFDDGEDDDGRDLSPSFRIDSPTTISAAAAALTYSNSYSSDEDRDDDEFAFVVTNQDAVAADEIFADGKIRPVYPVFDRRLLLGEEDKPIIRRLPLHKLFIEERENASFSSASSSEEVDELDGAAPGSYCVWDPTSSAARCKKSGSTGSSLKVKLRDLVRRSQSDGKEKFMFIPIDNSNSKGNETKGKAKITAHKIGGGGGGGGGRGIAGGRKTFLPYKQDLIGFFANVNTISRTHHPF